MSEAEAPDPAKVAKRIHDLARTRALRDLIQNHQGEYILLREGWVDYYKKQFNYVDPRLSYPPPNTEHGPDGRFVSKVQDPAE